MNKFDEYIQGRIYEAYAKYYPNPVSKSFHELMTSYLFVKNEGLYRVFVDWGIGKQRAKDYANYIVAYLEEQKEPIYTSAVAYADKSAIEKSHLTDEDAERIIKQLSEFDMSKCTIMKELGSLTYIVDYSELINFINSLKGE